MATPRKKPAATQPPVERTETVVTTASDAPPEGTAPIGGLSEHRDFTFVPPAAGQVSRIQRALGRLSLYSGPSNGKLDRATAKGIQYALADHDVQADGKLDTQRSVHAVQEFAKAKGSYVGPVDDRLTAAAWAGFVVGLERADG